ncbi:hypothetical protein EC973_002877 [Apophysomyces ossiformis]|uniref:Protection of telomeres protein 1 n=1 Tax=Apophysomyces ossiformis TaxID=679940 RepID=A0A8H7BN53_9FUNG|nr:hypothetical protein EC973_002877 [Apophysomyces ossiformis]
MTTVPDYGQELKSHGVQLIEDLTDKVNENVDIVGVVNSFRPIRQSSSGLRDYFYTMGIVDPSTGTTRDDEVRIMVFHAQKESLPQVNGVVGKANQIQAIPAISSKRPLLTTEAILNNENGFFDYIGEVVAMADYNRNYSSRMLLLTDYTRNPKPMISDTHDGSIEPSLLLQCSLFDENAVECSTLKAGDFVMIKNAVKRISNMDNLEIRVHGTRNPAMRYQKIKIMESDDPLLASIKKRRDTYHQLLTGVSRQDEIYEHTAHKVRTAIRGPRRKAVAIEDICSSERAVDIYRLRAYIMDYKPRNIKEWCVKWCQFCDEVFPISAMKCERCDTSLLRYSYLMMFLVKDARGSKLCIYSYGKHAAHLFADVPPTNLYDDSQATSLLEERADEICSSGDIDCSPNYLDFHIASHVNDENVRMYMIRDTKFVFE